MNADGKPPGGLACGSFGLSWFRLEPFVNRKQPLWCTPHARQSVLACIRMSRTLGRGDSPCCVDPSSRAGGAGDAWQEFFAGCLLLSATPVLMSEFLA